MKALKGNREYTISESEKAYYQKQGFDIVDDKGDIVEYGAGKTVPYDQYVAVVKELEQLQACANKSKELEDMTKPELEGVAKVYEVEYSSRATKDELIKLIKEKAGYKAEED